MDEIKDATSILKGRWPEVLLILSLNLLLSLGGRPLQQLLRQSLDVNVLLGLVGCVSLLALVAIDVLLPVGFQRSVHLEGHKRQSPLILLQMGKRFFWRAVGVGLLLVLACVFLAWLIFLVTKRPLTVSTDFWQTAQTEPPIYFGCYAVSQLILIKPLLLILPIIIVADCRISASFGLLKRFSLSEVGGLVAVFVTFTTLMVLRAFMPSGSEPSTISHYAPLIPLSLLQGLVGMLMSVMAIRFVGSRKLAADANSGPTDSDGRFS